MNLLYQLPDADKCALPESAFKEEKEYYCIPFNYMNGQTVSGFLYVTDKHIYKTLNGVLLDTWTLSEMSGFSVEKLYGCSGFFGKVNGVSEMICAFNSGRNLTRYSVLAAACNQFAEDPAAKPITSDEPENFCPHCGRPFIKGTLICPFCQKKSEVYKKLWGITKGMRLMLFFPLFAAIVSMAIRFIVPAIQKVAINKYIIPRDDTHVWSFLAVILAIVICDLLHRLLNVFQSRVASVAANRFVLRLRSMLFDKVQSLSMSSIQRKSTGDIMGRINNDVSVVQNFITNLLPTYLAQLFSFILALVLLLYMNPLMCLFVFIPLPAAIYFIWAFRKSMHRRYLHAWFLGQRTNRHLQDVLNGIRVVKAYGNEENAVKEFSEYTTKTSMQDESNAKLFDTVFPFLGFFLKIGSYLIMLYGNILLFNGQMLVGDLNQFNSYTSIIYEPMMQITTIPRNISEFVTSLSKVLEILEEKNEVEDLENPEKVDIKGDITVKNVTFGYDFYNPVLEHINMEIKSGEMIGIVGHSGCGKTTLINLIMRLYDVTGGKILIDGKNIRDISQNDLRSQIGVVLQETHLFAGSVRDNIRYAKPDATNEEVIAAARMANAHDFIMSLPEGYNTMVGEKGYSLSGGERQRIAIARALIHDPKILILDEATAALDTETEKLIQDAINKLTVGRTTIAIAHRLSTLRNADRIAVLDHGKLKELGTHRELLDMRGIYYKLVMSQQRNAQERD